MCPRVAIRLKALLLDSYREVVRFPACRIAAAIEIKVAAVEFKIEILLALHHSPHRSYPCICMHRVHGYQ